MDEFIEDILKDILIELDIDESSKDAAILRLKVKNALREVIEKIRFPKYYSESQIEKEIKEQRIVIHNVAMYDFCQIGSEWQASHSESNVNMTYTDRNKLFTFIPYSSFA